MKFLKRLLPGYKAKKRAQCKQNHPAGKRRTDMPLNDNKSEGQHIRRTC